MMGEQSERTHVLYHADAQSGRGELHEEVRITSNGVIVVEGWFYDWDYPSDEELFRLLIPADQTSGYLEALNEALHAVYGTNHQELQDPIEALKALPVFTFRVDVPPSGVETRGIHH